MRALLIPVEGNPTPVEVNDYAAMASAIGCAHIERVRVDHDKALVVDEIGRLTDKPINPTASFLYGFGVRHLEPIHGDVLLMFEGMVGDGVDYLDSDPGVLMAWLASRAGEQQ